MAIRNEFSTYALNETGTMAANAIAEQFSHLLSTLELSNMCGTEGREVALVRTHLQLASFYAKRAMAQMPVNQKTEAQ